MVNSIIKKVSPSATLAVKAKAGELKRAGKSILDLSPGEPDFDTPQHIKVAANKALAEGKTKYTPVPGIPELREAIAEKFTKQNSVETIATDVIISNGGKQALFEALAVTLEPGQEVIIPAPYWVSYPEMVKLCGGVPKIVETDKASGWKLTPELLEKNISEKTKWIIINSPSNPTGIGYVNSELAAIGEVIEKNNCYVLSDEVYERVVFPHFEFCSFAAVLPGLKSRTVTVNALSKTYSMTGWRVGYATGPTEIIKAMSTYQSHSTSNINSVSQYAALAAITGSHEFLKDALLSYEKRLVLLAEILSSVPGVNTDMRPDGAFYQFVRFNDLANSSTNSAAKDSIAISKYLIEEAGVAVVPGAAFGDDFAFRVSVAVSDETIREGAEKLASALSALT